MGTTNIFYTVKYNDTGEVAEKMHVVSSSNLDVYEEGFTEAIKNAAEYSEYETGRRMVITAFRIMRPAAVESKNATSNEGVL